MEGDGVVVVLRAGVEISIGVSATTSHLVRESSVPPVQMNSIGRTSEADDDEGGDEKDEDDEGHDDEDDEGHVDECDDGGFGN